MTTPAELAAWTAANRRALAEPALPAREWYRYFAHHAAGPRPHGPKPTVAQTRAAHRMVDGSCVECDKRAPLNPYTSEAARA